MTTQRDTISVPEVMQVVTSVCVIWVVRWWITDAWTGGGVEVQRWQVVGCETKVHMYNKSGTNVHSCMFVNRKTQTLQSKY